MYNSKYKKPFVTKITRDNVKKIINNSKVKINHNEDKSLIIPNSIKGTESKRAAELLEIGKCGFCRSNFLYIKALISHNKIIRKAPPSLLSTLKIQPTDTKYYKIPINFHFLSSNIGLTTNDEINQQIDNIIIKINNDYNQDITKKQEYIDEINEFFKVENIKYNKKPDLISKKKKDIYNKYINVASFNKKFIFTKGIVTLYDNLSPDVKEKLSILKIGFNSLNNEKLKQLSPAIDPYNSLNIWIAPSSGGILGISTFPWDLNTKTKNYHGILIADFIFNPYTSINQLGFVNEYKTFAHEIGHWLGLLHVFDNNTYRKVKQPIIRYNTSFAAMSGDLVADTPIQRYPTIGGVFDIRNYRIVSDSNYNPMFMNLMDYTNDEYLKIFTKDQILKMLYFASKYYTFSIEND
jgi:hypothetical protein